MARQTSRKFEFQMGWGGLLALGISTVCVLLWMFILGFWVGQKLVGRPSSEGVLIAPESGYVSPAPEVSIPTEAPYPDDEGLSTERSGAPAPMEEVASVPGASLKEAPISEAGPVEPLPPAPSVTSARPPEPVAGAPNEAPTPPQERPSLTKTTSFALQIASYRERARAEREVVRWRDKGYQTQMRVADLGPEKGIWYRVYLGRFRSMDEATGFARELAKKEGLKAYVVPVREQQ